MAVSQSLAVANRSWGRSAGRGSRVTANTSELADQPPRADELTA